MRQYCVYILANASATLYTGVTGDLKRRVWQHKVKCVPGFTKRYRIGRLVYYECMSDVRSAIAREKQIKRWRREKKVRLIESMNRDWHDLSEGWFGRSAPDRAPMPAGR
jgi:putative endonuclease